MTGWVTCARDNPYLAVSQNNRYEVRHPLTRVCLTSLTQPTDLNAKPGLVRRLQCVETCRPRTGVKYAVINTNTNTCRCLKILPNINLVANPYNCQGRNFKVKVHTLSIPLSPLSRCWTSPCSRSLPAVTTCTSVSR